MAKNRAPKFNCFDWRNEKKLHCRSFSHTIWHCNI